MPFPVFFVPTFTSTLSAMFIEVCGLPEKLSVALAPRSNVLNIIMIPTNFDKFHLFGFMTCTRSILFSIQSISVILTTQSLMRYRYYKTTNLKENACKRAHMYINDYR